MAFLELRGEATFQNCMNASRKGRKGHKEEINAVSQLFLFTLTASVFKPGFKLHHCITQRSQRKNKGLYHMRQRVLSFTSLRSFAARSFPFVFGILPLQFLFHLRILLAPKAA